MPTSPLPSIQAALSSHLSPAELAQYAAYLHMALFCPDTEASEQDEHQFRQLADRVIELITSSD
jgi:hypothetical protein